MNFDIILLCSGVVGAMFILVPLKELKKEYFLFASAALAIIIFVFSIKSSKPIFSYMQSFMYLEGSMYLKILIKVLGISVITNLTSELAQDLGVQGVSGKVEFAGKVAILLCAMPVYDQIFSLIGTIL